MIENRKHARIRSRLRCWCEGDNVTFYARVDNISEGGLFLRTSAPLRTGTQTTLRLRNGEAHEIQAEAVVVWARVHSLGGPPGMGLQFESLDVPSLEHLRRIISHELELSGASAVVD